MHDQPKYKPLKSSAFFEDGRDSRPLVADTVARGHLDDDALLYTGKAGTGFAAEFPFPVTGDVLVRGQERFNIYCSPCHDRTGGGDGMIVRRGYRRPPSFHIDRLRAAAGRLLLRRHHPRLRRHARLRVAGTGERPLGDRVVRSRPATEPTRDLERRPGRGTVEADGKP